MWMLLQNRHLLQMALLTLLVADNPIDIETVRLILSSGKVTGSKTGDDCQGDSFDMSPSNVGRKF